MKFSLPSGNFSDGVVLCLHSLEWSQKYVQELQNASSLELKTQATLSLSGSALQLGRPEMDRLGLTMQSSRA